MDQNVGGGASAGMGPDFLGAIFELVAHPIFVKDRQFRWVLFNRAFCEMVGRSRDVLLGKTDYDFFPRQEADWFRARDEQMFASGATVDVAEEFITDASGARHTIATTKAPLRNAAGEVTHLVGIIHDITRLKTAEEALRQVNDQLEKRVQERTAALAAAQEELVRKERLALLGQLAGGLAHQIRNPLAAITNAGYLMQKSPGAQNDAELKQSVSIVIEEAWKANRIITGLLDHARVRAADREICKITQLLDQAVAAHSPPDSVEIVRSIEAVPLVHVDPNQVREALQNLVRNALDAMPQGGTLTLETRREGKMVVVAVADTGPGIPPEQQRTLFRPLVTTKPQGLGLGLITARMLIENQGGNIAFVGSGKGARFEVQLPVAEQQQQPAPQPAP
ncbi:MAG TPA: ATP-binding protein [Myxococcales bacterium]|jgi:PAS domain S-box-containing protein